MTQIKQPDLTSVTWKLLQVTAFGNHIVFKPTMKFDLISIFQKDQREK
jgi:hypothetical protein